MAALSRVTNGVLSQLVPSKSRSLQLSLSLFLSIRGVASKLFVGGLSFSTSEKQLFEAFSQHGQVVEAKVIMDRVSDRSKGFGFVTFASEDEAETAKSEMDRKELNGRVIGVDYAKPKAKFGGGWPIATGPPKPATEPTME